MQDYPDISVEVSKETSRPRPLFRSTSVRLNPIQYKSCSTKSSKFLFFVGGGGAFPNFPAWTRQPCHQDPHLNAQKLGSMRLLFIPSFLRR